MLFRIQSRCCCIIAINADATVFEAYLKYRTVWGMLNNWCFYAKAGLMHCNRVMAMGEPLPADMALHLYNHKSKLV